MPSSSTDDSALIYDTIDVAVPPRPHLVEPKRDQPQSGLPAQNELLQRRRSNRLVRAYSPLQKLFTADMCTAHQEASARVEVARTSPAWSRVGLQLDPDRQAAITKDKQFFLGLRGYQSTVRERATSHHTTTTEENIDDSVPVSDDSCSISGSTDPLEIPVRQAVPTQPPVASATLAKLRPRTNKTNYATLNPEPENVGGDEMFDVSNIPDSIQFEKLSEEVTDFSDRESGISGSRSGSRVKKQESKPRNHPIDSHLPPIDNVEDCVLDMISRALGLGLQGVIEVLQDGEIRIATMMSGTEAPVIFLEMLSEGLEKLGLKGPKINHVFSAEIDVIKQGFIQRNFGPKTLFRDAREFIPADATTATTAYGAQVPIPGSIFILIAGFVCKDHSGLNNHKKGLDDNGESGDTWKAIYCYCKRYRPSIVLIENVTGQAKYWDSLVSQWKTIGYDCAWIKCDTKNYYIPQTRNRMYMIAINREHCTQARQCASAVQQWKDLMAKLERKCSSPFEQFLLGHESERSEYKSASTEPDWPLGRLRYAQVRSSEGLGIRRPITQWNENGSIRPNDTANHMFFKSQSFRVAECVEIQSLRAAKEGYDVRHSMEVWDVSQNVDRFKSTRGVISCITPSGCPFVTNKQDTLTGTELLLLQGMPMRKLHFATETQKDCQDLAGNAMTTTVIGASIMSALIVANSIMRISQKSDTQSHVNSAREAVPVQVESTPQAFNPKGVDFDIDELIRDSRLSSRLCSCEGSRMLAKCDINVCADCGHTACVHCSGSPVHNFKNTVTPTERLSPSLFERKWRTMLPSRLYFKEFPSIEQTRPLLRTFLGEKLEILASLLAEINTDAASGSVSLSQFCRLERSWKVLYESERMKVELSIADHIEWNIFIRCPKEEAGNSKLREMLQEAFLSGSIDVSSHILNARWQMRDPRSKSCTIKVSTSQRRVPSWRNRLGILAFHNETIPSELNVCTSTSGEQNITGQYNLLAHCGTAMENLYKSERPNSRAMYLFLEQDPIFPSKSAFVFSHATNRLKFGETRRRIATLDSWRPWNEQAERNETATCEVWIERRVQLCPVFSSLLICQPPVSKIPLDVLSDCGQAMVVLDVRVKEKIHTKYSSQFAWVFQEANRLGDLAVVHWQYIPDMPTRSSESCPCSPQFPRLTWSVDGNVAKAHEDRQDAAKYERNLKSRPSIFSIRPSYTDTETRIQVSMNIASLLHRVNRHGTAMQKLSWRIITDHSDRELGRFPKLTLGSTLSERPYNGALGFRYTLTEGQKRSLTWMISQESGKTTLTKCEVEEEIHHELGWRAEARSESEGILRGGALADLPSFGKTVIMIALTNSELLQFTPTEIIAQNRKMQPHLSPSLIDVAASLVICPPHIVEQWKAEFEACLEKDDYENYNILMIGKFSDLAKCKVDDVCRAHVVIFSWSVFGDEDYINHLAHFAAMPTPASLHGRPYDAWLDYVVDHIGDRIKPYMSLDSAAFDRAIESTDFASTSQRLYQERLSHKDFQTMIPLKIKHGKEYQSYEAGASVKRAGTSSSRHTNQAPMSLPLLQLFNFNRIVVDEYHYLKEHKKKNQYPAFAGIKRLSGYKRWVLSGTPSLSNFADVDDLASFLGVRLASDTRYHKNDQTHVDQFISRTDVKSYQWHQARHTRAQEFLNRFARQNQPELDHIKSVEILKPIELGMGHYAVYLEHSQMLASQDMQMKKKPSRFGSDRWNRFNATLNNAESAEEALQNIASVFEVEQGTSGLASLLTHRKDECKAAMKDFLKHARDLRRQGSTSNGYYEDFKKDVVHNSIIGDAKARRIILELFEDAEGESAVARHGESPGTDKSNKERASELREIAHELIRRIRNERFITQIQELLPHLGRSQLLRGTFKCSAPLCSGAADLGQLFLTAHCGHRICQPCLQRRSDFQACLADGCDSHIQSVNLVKATSLSGQEARVKAQSFGQKLDGVAKLIDRIPASDQVLLFISNEATSAAMERLLTMRHISFYSLGPTSSSRTLENFQSNGAAKRKVLILNPTNELASGSNLVNANHIIFVAPLLAKDQDTYNSAMAQAIARCRRYKQTKKVHVYHFAALKTIDIDILEHRHKLSAALTEARPASITAWPPALQTKERTKMIRSRVGEIALVPRSWVVDETLRGRIGVVDGEEFGSLIAAAKAVGVEDD